MGTDMATGLLCVSVQIATCGIYFVQGAPCARGPGGVCTVACRDISGSLYLPVGGARTGRGEVGGACRRSQDAG
eukprot:1794235-Prymnesium_polylepis.1